MEKWIVDRIGNEYIVIENNGKIENIKMNQLRFNVKEGDILLKDINGNFILDKNETQSRKEYIKKITEDLWEN